jgi:hypothetical protein
MFEGEGRIRQIAGWEPPLPKAVPGKGYAYYFVEVGDFTFEFASLEEIDVCISVLEQKHLPSTDKETETARMGPGSHWLNKLPSRVRPWRYREKAVEYLRKARKELEQEMKGK